MMNKSVTALSWMVALGLSMVSATADAEYRDLCDSTKVCEYTAPNAPYLDLDVCLNATGEVRLKGTTPCETGELPFHVRYGEVYDPIQQLIVAYTPLTNACSVPGICDPLPYESAPITAEEAICCIGAICWPGALCGGTIYWCNDGVSNEDGTVTCFDAEAL